MAGPPPGAERAADARPFAWLAVLFAVAALLIPPLAHGCHGDDIDHEPQAAPARPTDSEHLAD